MFFYWHDMTCFPHPLFSLVPRAFLTEGMKYNLKMILFWGPGSPFQNNWKLRDEFRNPANRLVTNWVAGTVINSTSMWSLQEIIETSFPSIFLSRISCSLLLSRQLSCTRLTELFLVYFWFGTENIFSYNNNAYRCHLRVTNTPKYKLVTN